MITRIDPGMTFQHTEGERLRLYMVVGQTPMGWRCEVVPTEINPHALGRNIIVANPALLVIING